jgi:hypothetical protein
MQALLTGIYSLYNANAALKAAMPGKLHFEIAPQGTSTTYGIYNLITGRPEYMLDALRYEILSIQFDIYASTNALRQTAFDALIALYDDARPAATGYSPVIMERTFYQMLREGENASGGGNQWDDFRAIIEYSCRWEKS